MKKLLEQELRSIGREFARTLSKTASAILWERGASSATHFDVFLTHAKLDTELLLGVVHLLETTGLRVFVDWREGHGVMQAIPSPSEYRILRRKMSYASTLLYVFEQDAAQPKCLPWELAHFEGSKQHVAKIRIFRTVNSIESDKGFLPLYPEFYFSEDGLKIAGAGIGKLKFSDWKHRA